MENDEKAPQDKVELSADALEGAAGGHTVARDEKGNRMVTPEFIKRVLPYIFKRPDYHHR